MFSFGVRIERDKDQFLLKDSITMDSVKLFYDELFEFMLLLDHVVNQKKQLENPISLTSGKLCSIVRVTGVDIEISLASLKLKISIGQAKAFYFLISKYLTFYPITGTNINTIDNFKDESTLELKEEIITEPNNDIATLVDKFSDFLSVILTLKVNEIDDNMLNELNIMLNNLLNNDKNISRDTFDIIFSNVQIILTELPSDLTTMRKVESEDQFPLLRQIWDYSINLKDTKRRLAFGVYLFIATFIETLSLLEFM